MFSYLHSRIRATASVGPGTPPPGLEGWTFLDAWETGGDGSPGSTLMKTNPSSVPLLRPISGGTISS
jgi:hypothetical protein